MSEPFDELRGQPDAEELARIARALDTAEAPGPRPEFLTTLRARIAAEPPRRSLWGALFAPRLRVAWAAALALLVALGTLFTTLLPAQGPAPVAAQRLVLVSALGFVTYDAATLDERERINVPAPEPWAVLAPDQRTLVFTFGVEPVRRMRVYDIETRDFKDVPGLRAPRQFALSRDGARAYVRDVDAIRVVDVPGATTLRTIPTPGVEDSPVYLAPDDRRLFQFLPQGGLVVYDVAEGRELRRLQVDLRDPAGLSASARVAFSPDASRLYAVGSTGSPTGPIRIEVLRTDSLATIQSASIDPASVRSLSRAETLASRIDRLLGAWGVLAEAKELGTVAQIALSPDGRTLYAARGTAGSGILVVDTQRLSPIGLAESTDTVFGLQLSPDGSRVFALAAPAGALGEGRLLAVDTRTYAVLASAGLRTLTPEAAVLILRH